MQSESLLISFEPQQHTLFFIVTHYDQRAALRVEGWNWRATFDFQRKKGVRIRSGRPNLSSSTGARAD